MFKFSGNALLSKSWINRAQIIKYFNPDFDLNIKIENELLSDDVISLQKAIEQISESKTFDLGLGGTSLRFFIFLISRLEGSYTVTAHPRLLERPQMPLKEILDQLGVNCELRSDLIHLVSSGWKQKDRIVCKADQSSQFVTGLMLSCWNLPTPIEIEVHKPITSFDYLKMTCELLRESGMRLETFESEKEIIYKIEKSQKSTQRIVHPEPDVSSIFSLAAAAIVDGEAKVLNWSASSTQPDMCFLKVFDKMKIRYEVTNSEFKISKHKNWTGLEFDLSNSPDLFPVLAVLCALGEGVSRLFGAKQLAHKESNRIKKTKELLQLCGFDCDEHDDGLSILGQTSKLDLKTPLIFNPAHDHRMAMAAGILKLKGFNIEISNPDVVNKSYPNFWKDIGL